MSSAQMPVRDFYESNDILAYVERYCISRPIEPWIFVHVPQSCPHQFRDQLADLLQPDAVVSLTSNEIAIDYDTSMQEALVNLTARPDFQKLNLISGHFKIFHVKNVPELDSRKRLTVLRDPIDRAIDDFNARNRQSGARGTPLTFLEFAKVPANQNVLLQYLTAKGMWKPEDCIEFILNEFDFVGLAENMNMTTKLFFSLFGLRAAPRQGQERAAQTDLNRTQVSRQIIDNVAKLNAADYQIYNHFRERFVNLQSKFFELNDYGRMFKALAEAT
jgi:hypothetical protein